jgi:hypothetical protein
MDYPNDIQAALLFDGRVDDLEAIVRSFVRIEGARAGVGFSVPEARPGTFYRLFGAGQLNVTLEYIDQPANPDVFQQSLASTTTTILCPDVRQRLTRSRSHILVNVSHGVLGSSPEIAQLMQTIGRPMEGQSLAEFVRRLEVCALVSRIVCDHAPARIVHWTQSNQLIPGEAFDAFAAAAPPGPLHVHPILFGQREADGSAKLGIRTFGVRHFLGREVLVEPNILPWAANYETILAFMRIAMTENGYVIPDGDTFGPENRSLSYRVIYREAEEGDVPLYELEPLMHRKHGFVAEGYVPPERAIDDRAPPAALMPEDGEAKMELANEWREKRALAEGIGGRFEVRAMGSAPLPPTRPGGPSAPGYGGRPVFGRKIG